MILSFVTFMYIRGKLTKIKMCKIFVSHLLPQFNSLIPQISLIYINASYVSQTTIVSKLELLVHLGSI